MDDKAWEEAFLAYGLDAAVGRLFRGLIHNLNGVAQAFSMQTELLGMFFSRAEEILQQLDQAKTLDESRELARKLGKYLRSRAALVPHLEREAGIMQEIMQRSRRLPEGRGLSPAKNSTLETIIATELEFLNGDPFFKHKVRKDLQLGDHLPTCSRNCLEIHQILGTLLENSAQALAERGVSESAPEPAVQIRCHATPEEIVLQVSDNGPGVAEADRDRIFAPFYTTRPGRLGLGLFLARKLAERCGGILDCQATKEGARFTLRLPGGEVGSGK